MKKKLFLLSSVLIIAFLLSDFIVYKQTKKNLLDFFFPKTQNKKEDGEMKLKRSDFSAAGETENNKTKVWYTCRFDELLDISKVEEAVIGY